MTPKSMWNPEGPWIPLYVDRLITSKAWRLMQDFHRGWYMTLMVESVKSERPGYLRFEENLWRLAGARSKQFFDRENAVVLACFRRREIDGETWIYNERLLATLEDQESKFYRGRAGPKKASPSPSPSDFCEEESTTTPTDLPPLSLAKGLIERLGLPLVNGLLLDVEAAIKCAMGRQDCDAALAFDYLMGCAQRARAQGSKINRFWFQDADGWELNGNQFNKTSKAKQRAAGNLRALGVLPEEDVVLGGAGDGEGFASGRRSTLGASRAKATGAD